MMKEKIGEMTGKMQASRNGSVLSFLPEFFEQSAAFLCQTVFLRGASWRIRLGKFDESRFNQRSHDAIS